MPHPYTACIRSLHKPHSSHPALHPARAPLPQTRTFLLAVSLLLSGASADRKKGTVLTFNEHAETAITAMRRPVVVMVHHARCASVR